MRQEAASWAETLPDELRWRSDFDSLLEVDKRLAAAGLLGVTWPAAYGGRGVSPLVDSVMLEELGKVGVRRTRCPSHQGVNNLGPALIAHGTPEQKAHHLPLILSLKTLWCQGFSEPDAGSDLASVRTTAIVDGDRLVVNGQKTWTSGADHADWIYALVRTGAMEQRHRGLSFVLVPMDAPGVSVRPIRQMTGESEFCEVYLDDVTVPLTNVVGGLGSGWTVAMTLLGAERLSGRSRYVGFLHEAEEMAKMMAGAPTDSQVWRSQLGRCVAEIAGMEAVSLRVASLMNSGEDTAKMASVNKLWWPAVHQRLTELGLRASEAFGADPGDWYYRWLDSRAESIYGGSAQIQRNILAERHLDMPRSPR